MTRSRRQKMRMVLAVGLAIPFVFLARPSQASNCASARVWQNGTSTPIGSCNYPGSGGEICNQGDETVAGNGAGLTACVDPPVVD